MNKFLSILFSFLFLNALAQEKKHQMPSNLGVELPVVSRLDLFVNPQGPVDYYLSSEKKIGESTKSGISIETLIGHSANPYTSEDARHLLSYDPDLNLMTFTHRQDPAEYGNVGNNAWVRYAVSFDGGNNWTENNGLLWDNNGGTASNSRYPQGFILNPQGNTIADSAYQVWIGPTLSGSNGAWGGFSYASLQVGGSDTIANNQTEVSKPYHHVPENGTMANGKAWTVGAVRYVDTISNIAVYQDSIALNEVEIQSGILTLTRRAMYMPVDMGDPAFYWNSPISWQIAFSPDGQIGYIAGLGRLDSIAYPKRALNLIYMKSTDAGATWSAPSEFYFADDTAIINNIGDSIFSTIIASASFEMDLVVDTFGNPHTLMNIEWRPDNFYGFNYLGQPSTIWHIYSPDGGSNWNFKKVFNATVRYGHIGSATNFILQENRPQLSRDPNGRYIMMAYFDSDTSIQLGQIPVCTSFSMGYCGNSNRFINTAGYNVVKDFYTPVKSWDFFLQGSYLSNFEVLAEIAPFDGSTVTVPYQYMKIDDKTNDLSPVDHYYESGVTYTKEELGDTTTVGLSQNQSIRNEVSVYPNPTNSELNIILPTNDQGNAVIVFNSMGQEIIRSNDYIISGNRSFYKLDVSKLNNGIYLIRVENSENSTRFIKN